MIPKAIKEKIEVRFGRAIIYSKDCEALALSIERVCSHGIGSTTLKRLFGFAKKIESPRRQTLDILAVYVGYPNWSSLLAETESTHTFTPENFNNKNSTVSDAYHTNLLHHQVSLTLSTQSINLGAVNALCKEFGSQKQIFPFIINMITIAANQKNVQFLKTLYNLPVVFDETINNVLDFYYIGQALGLALRTHPDIFNDLKEELAANKKAQQYFIEWFVDEDYLDGYYGKLLDAYHKHRNKTREEKLFYYALKYTLATNSDDANNQKLWYNKIKTIKFTFDIHRIPAGRFVGICLCEERTHNYSVLSPYYTICNQYVFTKSYDLALPFMFYLCRVLYRGKRYDWLTGILNDHETHFKKVHKNTSSHWELKIENQLLIYIAFSYLQTDSIQKAKEYYSFIDTNLFEPFIYNQVWKDYKEVGKLM